MSFYTQLTKCYRFRAIHHLSLTGGLEAQHLFHGHNYDLEITLQGNTWSLRAHEIDALVESLIIKRFDTSNLNDQIPQPTGEILCELIFDLLAQSFLGPHLQQVALQETRKNRFVCTKPSTP